MVQGDIAPPIVSGHGGFVGDMFSCCVEWVGVHSLNKVPEKSHASKYVMINPFSYIRVTKENIHMW